MRKVIAKFHRYDNRHSVQKFILDYFKNAFFLKESNFNKSTCYYSFRSNEDFWEVLLNERNTLRSLTLEGFRIVDWFPRSPGLFHTEYAKSIRGRTERSTYEIDEIKIYEPDSKFHMVDGGIGSVRFKPITIDGQEYMLCSATSDNYCHSGIPLAISTILIQTIDFSDYKIKFIISGEIKFLPDLFDKHFTHLSQIPRIYILVNTLEVVAKDNFLDPIQITPMVFFSTGFSKLNSKKEYNNYDNEIAHYVTYANCFSHSIKELNLAVDWLKSYVSHYNGVIITNFDEQRPAFKSAPFSLQNIMNHDFIEQVSNPNIFNVIIRQIETNGGNYNEFIQGNYIERNNLNQEPT